MAHFLFINANLTGLKAIKAILALGHDISYIESSSFICYADTSENKFIKDSLTDIYYFEDTDNAEKLLALATEINARKSIDGIICIAENSMESAAAVAEALALPFPSWLSVLKSRNKDDTRECLNQHGMKNAKFRYVKSYNDLLWAAKEIGYPLVIKPKTSLNSFGTAIVRDADGLNNAWEKIMAAVAREPQKMQQQFLRGFMVEEYLVGTMVSVEVFHDGIQANVFMISGRGRSSQNELVEYRIDMPARLTESEQRRCSEYTISVLSALGLSHGIFHIEVMLTASGPVLVEVNPRIMGSYMPLLFNNVTGNNIFSWLVDIHSGAALDQSKILKTDRVGSAIRFDVAKAGAYSPAAFTKLVQSCFSPVYAELPGELGIVNVKPGETIGRIQVIYPDHAALERDLTAFFSRVEQQLGLELLH